MKIAYIVETKITTSVSGGLSCDITKGTETQKHSRLAMAERPNSSKLV